MDPEVQTVLDEIVELGHVRIVNGKVDAIPPKHNICHFRWDRWTPTLKYLTDYAKHHEHFEGEFFVCLYDGWREYSKPSESPVYIPWKDMNDKTMYLGLGSAGEPRFRHSVESKDDVYPELPLKVITYNAHVNDRNAVIIPDAEFLENQFQPFVQQVKHSDVAWTSKSPIALWRGSKNITPGSEYSYLNTNGIHPREYVTRNTSILSIDASWTHTPIHQQLTNKYLLDVDGMVNAWSGLYWKLLSNSVVIKHRTHWHQWYYPLLKPNEHYIPVHTMQQLPSVVEWCKNNDEICRQIAENATNLVKTLTYDYAVHEYRIVI